MVEGTVQLSLYAIVILLILLRTEAFPVNITYVESGVAKGAVCLDGSPPAYHYAKGFEAGVNNWIIQIEGGGWCQDVRTCLSRKNTKRGSSKEMEKQVGFSGLLSNRPRNNPGFYNWNKVKIRYCDGSSFTGDVEAVDPATNLHYRGARVFLAIMDDLLEKGMKNAENAVLSGCSAGGLASILHCDKFKTLVPVDAKVKCFADAGFFINANDISGVARIEKFYSDVVSLHDSAKNLPPSCTSRMKPNLCFFPQYVAQTMETPLFLVNSAYDTWQIKNILAPGAADPRGAWRYCKLNILNCSASQLETMHGFRLEFLKALDALGPSSSRGYFINSCYVHCQTGTQRTWLSPDSPRLANKTIGEALGDWFHDRSPFQHIDCPYPCDTTCQNIVFESNVQSFIIPYGHIDY